MITINGRFLTQKITGVQRYAVEVSNALAEILRGTTNQREGIIARIPSPSIVTKLNLVPVRVGGHGTGHFWEQLFLPFLCNGVLLNLCNTYPIFGRRQVVVVHDASIYAMPDGYTRSFVTLYKLLFFFLRYKRHIRVVTDSEFSRQEIARYTGISAERIAVIHCGADHWERVTPDADIVKRLGLDGRQFLLAVASANPNKNLERLIAAYVSLERPSIFLVLVGGSNARVFADSNGNSLPGIIRTGYVSDPELAALYAAATSFLFPSLYEGFGLPPLEAMIFGCPVITSREASLPEVCGEAALYCNARSVDDIARAISQLLDDEEMRLRLVAEGYRQVQNFKWRDTAQALLNIVREFE